MDLSSDRFKKASLTAVMAVVFILAAVMIAYSCAHQNWLIALALGIGPVLLILAVSSIKSIQLSFYVLIIVSYFLPLFARYMDYSGRNIQFGLIMDAMIMAVFFVVLVQILSKQISFKHVRGEPVFYAFIWLFFCVFEGANLLSSTEAWMKSIRNMAVYFVAIIFLAEVAFSDFKYVKHFLVIWAVLSWCTILYTFKQKYIGFSVLDKFFLYAQKGYITHIINSGVRYFSIFSDAANMGAAMGVTMTVYIIAGLSEPKKALKWFYFITALGSMMALLFSGTRSALAVPFCGLAVYCLVSKRYKRVALIVAFIVSVFIFLNFTTIGDGNSVIRRARSVFNHDDASYQVRLDNRAKPVEYMKDKPLGYGVGLSGGHAAQFGDQYYEISQIATDSWFVQLWVETGEVGLVIYFLIIGVLLIRGMYIVRFKLKDDQVTGYMTALLCGFTGLFVMSSNNQVLAQIPNGILAYASIAIIFLGPHYDKLQSQTADIDNNGKL